MIINNTMKHLRNKLTQFKQWALSVVSHFLCSTKGHKWGKGETKQCCIRYGCQATRVLMWNRRISFKPALRWRTYDIGKFKFPKQ